jgi:gas vesicle protein GvpL/GvpF
VTAGAAVRGADDESAAIDGWYVFGIVPQATELPPHLTGGDASDASDKLIVLRYGRVGAVATRLAGRRPAVGPDDLQMHTEVLNELALNTPVLPLRFGTVLPDLDAVVDGMLAAGHDEFAAALADLAGRAQFTVRARYVMDAVLQEVLAEDPAIRRLSDQLRQCPGEAYQPERVHLGELTAEAVDSKREADAAELVETLAPYAVAVRWQASPGDDGIVDAPFLVEYRRQAEFEDAAEGVAKRWHGRARVRLIGPLAPYDFVSDLLGSQ